MALTLLAALLFSSFDGAQDKQAQQEPPVTTGSDRWSAVRLQVTGHLDLHYVYRSAAIDQTGALLNGIAPVQAGSENFWSGRLSLRTDVEVKDFVSGVLELENRSFERGINKPFGAVPPDSPIHIRQGYIEVGEFLTSGLNLRVGVQNVVYRNRPQDDAFFMNLSESEGFFRGFNPAGNDIVNTVDREISQPVGVRVSYAPFEIMTFQAFWIVTGERGGTDDETVYGFAANSLLGEFWSAWLLFAFVTGTDGLDGIATLGVGIDGYFFDDRSLEVFAEGYLQGGTLVDRPNVRKRAFAANLGARYLGFFDRKLWFEAALSHRSGDRRAGDDHDQAFQSYEYVNRFLIMDSAEFGLDVDTNVTCARMTVGVGPFQVDGRPLRVQLDVGRFGAVAPVLSVSRGWGVESDLGVTWNYNESFNLTAKAAWLADSDVLHELTGESHAWIFVFGADLRF
jgi:hypothetical protein